MVNMKAPKERLAATMFILLLSSSISITRITSEDTVTDTITLATSLNDGGTIVSSGGKFKMGFFSPGNSNNRYLGIWYGNIPERTVIWVANRETPITNTSTGMLKVIHTGIVVMASATKDIIWSSSNASRNANDPFLQLLDTGNLVFRDKNDEKFLWQSFDYPCDTLLPGMKLGKDFETGLERYLSSWKSADDPAPGDFTYHCDPTGYPHNVLRKGEVVQYRTGPWNGVSFSGAPNLRVNTIYTFTLVFNEKEVYYSYNLVNLSVISRFTLNHTGVVQRWTWVDQRKGWVIYLSVPTDINCDRYLQCGAYGSCNSNKSPECGCLSNFQPKYQNQWDQADWSSGCERKTALDCKTDGFVKLSGVKLPDSSRCWFNKSVGSLKECGQMCLKNCSCMAYSNLDIRDGSGCLLWHGDLLDIEEIPQDTQELHVRMAFSDLGTHKKGKRVGLIVPLVAAAVLLCIISLALCAWRKKINRQMKIQKTHRDQRSEENYINDTQNEDVELPMLGFLEIAKATNNFSVNNKIGEGGFGPVYKGVMEGGQEIAVKRLSRTSGQGLDEFKNEVICISKLQHRNLVKLLGCCIQGHEKMLIYEYMPNKSLDYFIFDENQSTLLDWPKRFNIINGIARGLQYLHQDSRLRIIHRDLKASNVLLDHNMYPKISDFGMARSFLGNETEAETERVVGTYGYMSPEYAVDGLFSVKSDVFSFGVLVLEIVSGKKNRGFVHHDHYHNLLGHAWILHNEDKIKELIDPKLVNSCNMGEVSRSILVSLLCVQQSPEDRPSMSSVVVMLSSDGGLPQPKQPGFYTERNILQSHFSSSTNAQSSINEVTITRLDPR